MEVLPTARPTVPAYQAVQQAPAQRFPVAVDRSAISISGNFDMLPIPPAMTQTIASATGNGAVAVNAYFLNEAYFNATPTNNGSGANSVVVTYGDGWSGKGYTQLAQNGNGIQCYGLTLQYITTNGGAQNPSGLTTANPTIVVSNLVGSNQIPRGLVLSAGASNTQYLAGVMTVNYMFRLNCLSQLQYAVPVGNTATLTVLTQPQPGVSY